MAIPTPEELNAEARKPCEKCGFIPDEKLMTEHFMTHQKAKYGAHQKIYTEAMIFKCYRCRYTWSRSLEKYF